MSWLPVLLLAVAAFAAAIFVLRLPKSGRMLFGAALLFGLTGYAWQGMPGYAGAPKQPRAVSTENNFAMIEARRAFFSQTQMPSRFVTVSDAFARKGRFQDAANMLGNAVSDNPRDAEAWVALGNALVEYADGSLTPPAIYAYGQATQAAPSNPAGRYFLGIGYLRTGQPANTREIWAELLDDAPQDAKWRPLLAERLARLDALLERAAGSLPPP